jgi:hypothetical protein
MKRLGFVVCAFSLVMAAACAPTAPLVLTPEAQRITVGQSDPGPGYLVVDGVDVIDGSGCGAFGTRGSFNGALKKLRFEAGRLHGDFIKIVSTKEPYATPPGPNGQWGCYHNAYSISAIVYKKSESSETP